jgi:glycosyltransferase involved in cell wall biosynthesis
MADILFWSFLISAGIQFLFFALVSLAFYFYKPFISGNTPSFGISVIVCANNEYKNLKALIPKLLEQDYPEFEVILVDDKSSDETYDYAIDLKQREEKFKLKRIDSRPEHINNKKYAITIGIKAARHEHILLTDADCLPQGSNWIQHMSLGYKNEQTKFVIGYSQYQQKPGFLNMFIRYETLLTAVNYVGIGLLGNPYMAVGRNLSYKKSLFLENNGFGKHQGVVGGDDDLLINRHANRKNTRFVLSENALVSSIPKATYSEYSRQKTRHLSVGKHYKLSDKWLLGLLSLSKIVFWLSFFAAIMSVNQTILISGGFFMVMVSLLTALLSLKKRTGDNSGIWMFPLLDIIYIFYYISTSLKVLFTKKIRWK